MMTKWGELGVLDWKQCFSRLIYLPSYYYRLNDHPLLCNSYICDYRNNINSMWQSESVERNSIQTYIFVNSVRGNQGTWTGREFFFDWKMLAALKNCPTFISLKPYGKFYLFFFPHETIWNFKCDSYSMWIKWARLIFHLLWTRDFAGKIWQDFKQNAYLFFFGFVFALETCFSMAKFFISLC